MADDFSAVNKTLKETTDFLKDKAAQDAAEAAKTRAVLEKTAANTGKSLKDIKDRAYAKLQIKKQDEATKVASENKSATMQLLGISQKRMDKADELSQQIEAQELIMAEQKAVYEKGGLEAEKVPKFQKEQIKLDKLNAKKDKVTGAAASEDDAKQEASDGKMLTYLKSTAGFLGGIAKAGAEKVKAGLDGFAKFAFGGLAIAALSFLNSPQFDKYYDQIVNTIVPALTTLYNEVIKPLAIYIKDTLFTAFEDIQAVISGEKGIFEAVMNNKVLVATIATFIAVKMFSSFMLLFKIIKGIVIGAKFIGSKLAFGAIFAKIAAAFAVVKAFFVATLMPFLAAAAVPIAIIVGVVAGVVAILYGIKKGFDDFMFELEATGSIWEALKTAFVSFFANGLGIILDPIKDGISWILGKIGSIFGLESFTNASSFLDSFSFVDLIKDGLNFVGDAIASLIESIKNFVQTMIRKIPFGVGDKIADKLFGTEEEQKAAKKAEAETKLANQKAREELKLANEMAKEMELEDAEAGKAAIAAKKSKKIGPKITTTSYSVDRTGLLEQIMADSRKDKAKNQGATTVVDAKSINASNNSSNVQTGTTPVRNSNPFLSAFGNTSDFPRPA